MVGEAVDYQVFIAGLQDRGDGQQVFFTVDADVGFVFDGVLNRLPDFFLDSARRVFYGLRALMRVRKVLALDLAVKDFNIGLDMGRTVVADGNDAAVFFLLDEFAILLHDLALIAIERLAERILEFGAVFFWQKVSFWHKIKKSKAQSSKFK